MATIRDRYVLDVDTKGATSSINKIKGALGALAGALAIREFAQFTASIVDATTQFERYQTVLTTFLGSQQKANQELSRLKDLANSLPQDLADITEAFVIFTRYGLDTSSEGIKNFSNIATASGKSLEQLAEALGDALTGEFERLKEFGIKVSRENGKIIARIGDDTVAAANDAKTLVTQLQALGNTRFGGAAEANAGTLSQSMSNLKGAVFETQVAFGEGLKPALIEITNQFALLLRNNEELAKSLGAGVGEALRTLAAGAKLLIDNIDLIRNALIAILSVKAVSFFAQLSQELRTAAIGAKSAKSVFSQVAEALTGVIKRIPGVGLLTRTFTAMAGPIGIAVTAVTALTAGVKALAPRTVELGNVTSTFGEAANAVWWKLSNTVSHFAGILKEKLGGALTYIRNKLAPIGQLFKTAFEKITNDVIKASVNTQIGLFVALYEVIRQGVIAIPTMFVQVFNATTSIIRDFISRAGKQFKELWDYISSLGENKIENAFTGLSDSFAAEVDKINNEFEIDFDNILNTDYVSKFATGVKTAIGKTVIEYRNAQNALKEYDDAILRVAKSEEAAAEQAKQLAAAQAKIAEAMSSEAEARDKTIASFDKSLAKFRQEYEFRTSLINLTDDQRELEEKRFEIQQKLTSSILPVQQRILELEKLNTDESRARIQVLREGIATIRDNYETELMYLDQIVEARNAEMRIKRESESIDNARKSAAEAVLDVENRIRDARENAELGGLSGIQRELREIEIQERRIARAAKARVTAQLESGVDASVVNAELARIDAAAQESIRIQQNLAKTAYENSRSFSTGWRKAFEEYEDNATNAAQNAQRLFEKATSGMEDAIVGFAKTGKFEFKSFVNSILEELLRSQVRQLIAKTFGAFGGGSGSSGGGGLFGGFFATGGMIPPGRFGVVGENGPELVSGPANVTPNIGGGNVTYNINAVDAMSFKQMVAKDPEFLYAVTEQGRRSVPQTRR